MAKMKGYTSNPSQQTSLWSPVHRTPNHLVAYTSQFYENEKIVGSETVAAAAKPRTAKLHLLVGGLFACAGLILAAYFAASPPAPAGLRSELLSQVSCEDGLAAFLPYAAQQAGGKNMLKRVSCNGANLGMPIPSEIGEYSELTHLDLTNSNVVAQIPSQVGLLTKLTSLLLSNNTMLSGRLPETLGNLVDLQILDVSNNLSLDGNLPSALELRYSQGLMEYEFIGCKMLSLFPTRGPTNEPTKKPTNKTTKEPTKQATTIPTSKPTNKPTKQTTSKPTNKPTNATGPPSTCSAAHGCTAAMLANDYCDLRCHTAECNHDNGKCGGYLHIEYTGNKNQDPRIMPAMMEAARLINKVIKPEAQMPYRTVNTGPCWWTTDIPAGLLVNQLIIVAGPAYIDGQGGTLAQAGPCAQSGRLDGTRFAINGQIKFDEDDLIRMIDNDLIVGLIMHEVGHALGIGTLWGDYNLIKNNRWINGQEQPENKPTYSGVQGNAAWKELGGSGDTPIEDNGGPGSADGHWEEDIFKDELMSGWLSYDPMPMSKVTVGSFADMGIPVYLDQADTFTPNLRRRLKGSAGAAAAVARDLIVAEEHEMIQIGSDTIVPIMYKEVQLEDGTMRYDGSF